MSNVILQPSGSASAREHYVDTVINPVSLDKIRPHISANDYNKLIEIYPSGDCMIWGVTPSKLNINKWKRIKIGDITLFSSSGKIYSSGVTTYKLHSKSLAEKLWGYNEKGETWEYVYFVDEVKSLDIPYIAFNKVVGYADNYVIQGFNILDDEKSIKVINGFDLESDIYSEDVTYDDFIEITKQLEIAETDELTKGYRRKEQTFLRQNLFGRRTIFVCSCCGVKYPISFLVTAHIKKRSLCNTSERLDTNIVMPLCKFGCDDLFEKGYISVKDGRFIELPKTPVTEELDLYISKLKDNVCDYYSDDTKKYFEWHFNHHK